MIRSRSDRILGGVCAGLARYFGTDPLLIRLVFVVITLAQGAGILLYILLWILMPEEGVEAPPAGGEVIRTGVEGIKHDVARVAEQVRTNAPSAHRQGAWLGVLLVGIGAYLLAVNTGAFWWWDWRIGGPVVLMLAGLFLLLRRLR
ncbi:MAG TPA: PspC domain-containing protein [Candidatus Dormibacteraeota bacterium]|nr:PspC domain-containing protein [Candidatus Dormibacteraeota bacterium]